MIAPKPSAFCPCCSGDSAVRNTRRLETWYVSRRRECLKCGHLWSTAEVPLEMLKRTEKLDIFIQELSTR